MQRMVWTDVVWRSDARLSSRLPIMIWGSKRGRETELAFPLDILARFVQAGGIADAGLPRGTQSAKYSIGRSG